MNVDEVHRNVHAHKSGRRLGRGTGSGRGKTSGRGHKGQKSRSGVSFHPAFQGGAMPLVRRVPKRGFHNRFALSVQTVNVGDLEQVFSAGDDVTLAALESASLIKGRCDVVKVLADGELTKKLNVSAHRFSKAAEEKIKQAGGTANVVPGKTPVAQKQS